MKRLTCFAAVFVFALTACGGDDGGGGGDNMDPSADFTATPGCTSSSTDPLTFASTSTDPDQDTLTCSWTFSSGTPSSSTECTATGVTFPHLRPYQVTLTVNDGNGGTDTMSMNIDRCP